MSVHSVDTHRGATQVMLASALALVLALAALVYSHMQMTAAEASGRLLFNDSMLAWADRQTLALAAAGFTFVVMCVAYGFKHTSPND